MALHKVAVPAKDGVGTAIPGGIQQHDTSGTGAGPNQPLIVIVDSSGNEVVAATAANQTSQITQETAINTVLGVKTDAASTATDATAVTHTSIFKQISKSVQALAAIISSGKLLVTASIDSTSVNTNLEVAGTTGVTSHQGSPTVNLDVYSQYEPVAASQTAAPLGATGATGDYLAGVHVYPGAASCGVVTILDGSTVFGTFAGGSGSTTPLPTLVPFTMQVGAYSKNGGWKITTGANVTATGVGKFT